MKTRIIHTKIWKDEFLSELTPTEKLLFIYYITNERVNIIHCYEITDREVMFDTGIDRGIIEAFKEKVRGKIAFKDSYVFLLNASRYESYKGNLNETAKVKLLGELPKSILDWYNNILNTGIDTPLKGTINNKSEIINNKSENILGDFEIFLQTFNELFNTSYKPTKTRRDKFKLRSVTFSPLDILRALQNMARQPFYTGRNDRKWRADPDYFLRSDEIIDKHLNGKEDTPKMGVLDKYADRLN